MTGTGTFAYVDSAVKQCKAPLFVETSAFDHLPTSSKTYFAYYGTDLTAEDKSLDIRFLTDHS